MEKLNISGGLVEIAALTALIGGSTAESLSLGNCGACGLPWAALSSFGSLFILKACISACTPAWLRDTMGVRTARSDSAVGCNINLDRKAESRGMTGSAVGVMVEWSKDGKSLKSPRISRNAFEDVYAFDEWTAGPLRSCTATQLGEELQAHIYMRDHYWTSWHRSQIKSDWVYTFITLTKVVEIYLLYHYGSRRIVWVTGVTWAYFFLSAIVLQIFHKGRAAEADRQAGYVDIVAGPLPTAQVVGGDRKVLFDVPVNVRRSRLWKAFWTLGSIVCVCSLIGTYALLTKEPEVCFRIWVVFQILWLSLRSLFYHFTRQLDHMKHTVTPPITAKQQPAELGFRLLGLATAVSKYQVLTHPRGAYSYAGDVQDPVLTMQHLDEAHYQFTAYLELPRQADLDSPIDVTVAAVLGDTLLSSVAWLMGSPLTGIDLYDCCVLAIRASNRTLLIPSCRVLSGRVTAVQDPDPEMTLPSSFLPKGASNMGRDISWRYWIPCQGGRWVYYSTPWTSSMKSSLSVIGDRKMMVTTGDKITEELEKGTLLVSMSSVRDVADTVTRSAEIAMTMRDMLLGNWLARKEGA